MIIRIPIGTTIHQEGFGEWVGLGFCPDGGYTLRLSGLVPHLVHPTLMGGEDGRAGRRSAIGAKSLLVVASEESGSGRRRRFRCCPILTDLEDRFPAG